VASFRGEIEPDESYIGGKAPNMNKSVKAKKLQGKGGGIAGKIAVRELLERGGAPRRSSDRQQPTSDRSSH
jgi:hypothetical protein